MSRKRSWLVRLVLALCPSDVRGLDGEAISTTLEARLEAARRRGPVAVAALAARELSGASIEGTKAWLAETARNLRIGVRGLVRRPDHAVVIVVSFAVGIGATTAIFAVVRGVLLDPLPWPDPDRLVEVRSTHRELGLEQGASEPDYRDWRRHADAFDGLTAWYGYSAVLTTERLPMRLSVGYTAPDFFEVLRSDPAIGRLYRRDPDGVSVGDMLLPPEGTVVLSHEAWIRLGGDPGIVGDSLTIDGAERTVAGVVSRDHSLLAPEVDAWMPWRMTDQQRNSRFLRVVGRLATGVDPRSAHRQLTSVAMALADAHPATNEGWGVAVTPLRMALLGEVERPLWILLGAASLVLLATCSNVATLLLARGRKRTREVAVRVALGASRGQVLTQRLVESTLLAAAGALAGTLAARPTLDGLLSLHGDLPRSTSVSIDGSTLLVAAALALATGLLAGWLPARNAVRADPAEALRAAGDLGGDGDRSREALGIRGSLLVAQVAVVVVLLCGAGLMLRSFDRLLDVSPGFEPRGVLVADLQLEPRAASSPGGRVALVERVIERAGELVGVESAGGVTVLPFRTGGVDFNRPFWRHGEPAPAGGAPEADIRMATPDYFRTLGIPLLAGRDFEREDRFEYGRDGPARRAGRRRVVIVNRSLAERTWPDRTLETVVGRRLAMDYPGDTYDYEIVGVVDDTRAYALDVAPRPEIFIPYAQNPYPGLALALRFDPSIVDGRTLGAALAEAVADVDPAQPVHGATLLTDLVASSLERRRFVLLLVGAFSTIALLVAVVGLYGLVSAGVRARTREFGIRAALGARRGHLLGLAMFRALGLAACGTAAGLLAATSLTRAMDSLLYGVRSVDPVTFASVPILMLLVVVIGAYVPARRVLAVDPARSLKAD